MAYPKMRMRNLCLFSIIVLDFSPISALQLKYLDNYGSGLISYGATPDKMDRYATLTNDPIENLPDSFTICSAIHVKFRTSIAVFFQLYQEDGSPWINFYMIDSFLDDITDRFKIVFNEQYFNLWPNNIPVVPHSWYRGCLGVDTVSGRIRIYVDGSLVLDKDIDFFKESSAMKPSTLKDRVGVFKSKIPGLWYNARGRVSDVQVHSSLLTSDDMINITSNINPNCVTEGDYHKWADMEWNTTGEVVEGQVDVEELCENKISSTVFLPEIFQRWKSCMQFCPKMSKSRSPSIINQYELDAVADSVRKITFKNGKPKPVLDKGSVTFWLPISDSAEEGTWVDYYSQEKTELSLPKAGRLENCGLLWLQKPPRLDDWTCQVPPTQQVKCVCQNPEKIYLRLRGLCPTTNIDFYYTPSNDKDSGHFTLLGLKKTSITFHDEDSKWDLKVSGITQKTVASSKAPVNTFLLGTFFWEIADDNKGCSNLGVPYSRFLKLTGCEEDQYTCRDGQCIIMTKRCDQVVNCRDKSDEEECSLLVIEGNYNKKVAPFEVESITENVIPAKVNISITLFNVIDIKEVNHIISLKFGISLEWYENRAEYHNLKQQESFNSFSDEEIGRIWIPYVIYKNTDNNEAVQLADGVKTTISVTREGDFARSGMDVVDEIEIFKGNDNKLTMNQTYSKEFQCTYLIQWFPFDTQVCSIHMVLPEFDLKTVKLVPDKIIMESGTELTQYFIQEWTLNYKEENDADKGVKMQIIFKRRLTNEILTTYLPTALLILIVYATTYFKQFFFEAALTVNLTVMLVVTTLFISVMEKLPPTSYIRMVDIWLIYGILIPFCEVAILTIKECNNLEKEQSVNHHGSVREVSNISNEEKKTVSFVKTQLIVNNEPIFPSEKKGFFAENEEEDIHLKRVKQASYLEQKILPAVTILFIMIYWAVGLGSFYDLYKTY